MSGASTIIDIFHNVDRGIPHSVLSRSVFLYSSRSYVAAFIITTAGDPEFDAKANWALWVGYEVEPNVVVWPEQYGMPEDKNEYKPDTDETETFYTLRMLKLHEDTFSVLRQAIHEWEAAGEALAEFFSPLYDLYSDECLGKPDVNLFSGPLLRWMMRTLAPLRLGGQGAAAARKCVKQWKAKMEMVGQRGGSTVGFRACSGAAKRVSLAGLEFGLKRKAASRIAVRRGRGAGDGTKKANDSHCSSSSSADISSSSSSSSSADENAGNEVRGRRRRLRRSSASDASSSNSPVRGDYFLLNSSRLLDDRPGRWFSDIRCRKCLPAVS